MRSKKKGSTREKQAVVTPPTMLRSLVASSSKGSPYSKGYVANSLIAIVSGVPASATPGDIRALCAGQPASASQGEAPLSASSLLGTKMKSIDFVRTRVLNPSGKVVVRFHEATQTRLFAKLADGKTLGGNTIKASLTDRNPQDSTPAIKMLAAVQRQALGRVVRIRGLPYHISAKRLEKILGRYYQLAPDTVQWSDQRGTVHHLGAIVNLRDVYKQPMASSFLVRLQTVSDAMMLVRRWHRAAWNANMSTNVSLFGENEAGKEEREDMEDDDDGENEALHGDTEEPLPEKWKSRLHPTSQRRQETPPPNLEVRHIIDAHIMH